jgi:hypothetical protein
MLLAAYLCRQDESEFHLLAGDVRAGRGFLVSVPLAGPLRRRPKALAAIGGN